MRPVHWVIGLPAVVVSIATGLVVLAAAAVVGLLRQEGAIIRFTLLPMLYYTTAAGLLALAFVAAS